MLVFSNEKNVKKIKIGIQVGHWKNEELPDELANLRGYRTGTEKNNITEWEVVLSIAKIMQRELEKNNYTVDLLPATIPENYRADAFISLHADDNNDPTVTGFKVTSSIWDQSGKAEILGANLETNYRHATDLSTASFISPEMEYYYAFNHKKFKHTINPKTPAVIFELGFLTNFGDRRFLVEHPEKAATGLVKGLEKFI